MIQAVPDQRSHSRNQLRCILIIGMNHDDNVTPLFHRQPVAGFLIAAVSQIALMPEDPDIFERIGNI